MMNVCVPSLITEAVAHDERVRPVPDHRGVAGVVGSDGDAVDDLDSVERDAAAVGQHHFAVWFFADYAVDYTD